MTGRVALVGWPLKLAVWTCIAYVALRAFAPAPEPTPGPDGPWPRLLTPGITAGHAGHHFDHKEITR